MIIFLVINNYWTINNRINFEVAKVNVGGYYLNNTWHGILKLIYDQVQNKTNKKLKLMIN